MENENVKRIVIHIISIIAVSWLNTAGYFHWLLVVFSLYPNWRAQVVQEVDHFIPNENYKLEDLDKLKLFKAVISETLRLYPPAISLARKAKKSDNVIGYEIPEGAGVIIDLMHIHRHPDYWENPQCFDPSRFVHKRLGQDHSYAYMPFGAGKRACIAPNFVYTETLSVFSLLLKHFEITLPAFHNVRPYATSFVSQRPSYNYMNLKIKS